MIRHRGRCSWGAVSRARELAARTSRLRSAAVSRPVRASTARRNALEALASRRTASCWYSPARRNSSDADRSFRMVARARSSSRANASGWAAGTVGRPPGELEAGEEGAGCRSDGDTVAVWGPGDRAPPSLGAVGPVQDKTRQTTAPEMTAEPVRMHLSYRKLANPHHPSRASRRSGHDCALSRRSDTGSITESETLWDSGWQWWGLPVVSEVACRRAIRSGWNGALGRHGAWPGADGRRGCRAGRGLGA